MTPKNSNLAWVQVSKIMEKIMKKIFILFIVNLIFITPALAELKLGFVKVDQILKDAPQAEASNKKLEGEFKSRTEKLKKEIEVLNQKEKDFKKNLLTLSDDDKQKQQKKLQEIRIDLQRSERELREDIDLRRREEITKLQAKVTEVIESLAVREKFDLILYTGVAYASDKTDITSLVLKELRAKK
jgi:outer membrane protein